MNYKALDVVHIYQQQQTRIRVMKKLREEAQGHTLQL
jgi:hypothetical protein